MGERMPPAKMKVLVPKELFAYICKNRSLTVVNFGPGISVIKYYEKSPPVYNGRIALRKFLRRP